METFVLGGKSTPISDEVGYSGGNIRLTEQLPPAVD